MRNACNQLILNPVLIFPYKEVKTPYSMLYNPRMYSNDIVIPLRRNN
jgi:hypothetical protein